jgi:hypothetical protein
LLEPAPDPIVLAALKAAGFTPVAEYLSSVAPLATLRRGIAGSANLRLLDSEFLLLTEDETGEPQAFAFALPNYAEGPAPDRRDHLRLRPEQDRTYRPSPRGRHWGARLGSDGRGGWIAGPMYRAARR